jgi:hypothetical protein
MNRRAFLQVLAAGTAALAIPDRGAWKFLAAETPTFAPMAETGRIIVSDLHSLTRAITAEIGNLQLQHGRAPFLLGTDDEATYKIGHKIGPAVLTNQVNIQLAEPAYRGSQDEIYARTVRPAAGALFERFQRDKADVFAAMSLPTSMNGNGRLEAFRCRDNRSGLSLRGMHHEYYDLILDEMVNKYRFDALYGRTEAA